MTAKEIRDSFKKYFESKQHAIVPSAPMACCFDSKNVLKESRISFAVSDLFRFVFYLIYKFDCKGTNYFRNTWISATFFVTLYAIAVFRQEVRRLENRCRAKGRHIRGLGSAYTERAPFICGAGARYGKGSTKLPVIYRLSPGFIPTLSPSLKPFLKKTCGFFFGFPDFFCTFAAEKLKTK